jgi:mannitol 2-dehydrogenase
MDELTRTTVPLSLAALPRLPAAVARPAYARADLSAGILHFGLGNFHRAHQAAYLDRLMNAGYARDWAIVGAGVFEAERRGRDLLAGQDWLTTLVEQSADATQARVLGSMVDYIDPGDGAATVARMVRPDIRIVSLTVTEGGYFLDAEGQFDPDHPAIRADAAAPEAPRTVFGQMLAALRARRAAGVAPFTVMCCDNIPHNGAVTMGTLTGLARLSDPALADWIAAEVAFPNAMVDRITPATTDRERAFLAREFGVDDAWPVFCEDFTQWVLEDRFPQGRPPLEEAGVEFVADVAPWELMKLRILNGGHAVIAYPAGLLGIHYVHEAMAHPLIRAFLRKVETDEIIPGVPPVPGTELQDYLAVIEQRFANPRIGDTVRRLCLDGSNRQPKFILPAIRAALAGGGPVTGLALESALWCRYCAGVTDAGDPIEPNDPNWDALVPVAQAARHRPAAWLEQEDIYGDLAREDRFADAFAGWVSRLWAHGTAATLRTYLGDT